MTKSRSTNWLGKNSGSAVFYANGSVGSVTVSRYSRLKVKQITSLHCWLLYSFIRSRGCCLLTHDKSQHVCPHRRAMCTDISLHDIWSNVSQWNLYFLPSTTTLRDRLNTYILIYVRTSMLRWWGHHPGISKVKVINSLSRLGPRAFFGASVMRQLSTELSGNRCWPTDNHKLVESFDCYQCSICHTFSYGLAVRAMLVVV